MRHAKPRLGRRTHLRTPVLRLVGPPRDTCPSARAQAALVIGDQVHVLQGEGASLILGASSEADIHLAGTHVSGRHARVVRRDGGLWIEDLGSTNGTWRKGERIIEAPLHIDDCVVLGRSPVLVGAHLAGPGRRSVVRWHGMVARDPKSLATLAAVGTSANAPSAVWIRGASGTGKEGVARALHKASDRGRGPFVALNCAALPEALAESELFGSERGAFTGARTRPGAFQQAHGGTLFLDEVGDLPRSIQAKLLRVLESGDVQPVGAMSQRRVDVRVVSATWRDLDADAEAGRFRFDLLQRLSVLRIAIPSLAERPGDIKPLVESFLDEFGAQGLQPDLHVWAKLLARPWNGNVRELRNVIRRAALAGTWFEIAPDGTEMARMRGGGKSDMAQSGERRGAIARRAIDGALGNRARAARSLGVSRSTLYRWLTATG